MKTIDLKKKLNVDLVADMKNNYQKASGQEFYYSPSGKMLHLVEKLPNGDYWFVKTWRKNSILATR